MSPDCLDSHGLQPNRTFRSAASCHHSVSLPPPSPLPSFPPSLLPAFTRRRKEQEAADLERLRKAKEEAHHEDEEGMTEKLGFTIKKGHHMTA
eukprot:754199-Hanusia_phi.AAC.1